MSAPPVINGTPGAYEQPIKYGVNDTGPYLMRTWVGTLQAVEAMIPWVELSGGYYELKRGIGIHTLEARYSINQKDGSAEIPIDTWEFFANHAEKDVLEADNSAINALNADDKKQIKYLLANPPASEDDIPAWKTDTGSALYALMESGMRTVRVNAPVLRHTQTVSNIYTVKAAITNVGRIFSTATLATFENIPGTVLFNLPNDVSARTGLSYGWFKTHPTVRAAARNKMQIELEYEYGLWPTLIYGSVI